MPGSGAFARLIRMAALAVFILSMGISLAHAATLPGTVIPNTAKATYQIGVVPGITSNSNTVNVTTTLNFPPPLIEFYKYAPTVPTALPVMFQTTEYSSTATTGGPFVPIASINRGINNPALIDLSQPVAIVKSDLYHSGDPVFIKLTDLAANLNPSVAEQVVFTLTIGNLGELEVLRVVESGPDTGVFYGYIQSEPFNANLGSGKLSAKDGSVIVADYTNAFATTTTASALVDPYGIVFDSFTGNPVNGATVTLMNASTGLPAAVLGDDGISTYPSTVTTGGTATDSSGKVYAFPPGGYRFPYVSPGQYRLDVTPTTGYRAPSQVPTSDIQSLPGAPFAIVTGSRNEVFTVNPGPALNIDIPVDPSSVLFLTKAASKQKVFHGEFLQYRLTLQNSSPVTAAKITDRLPLGFRYRSGSTKINGAASGNPAISSDGRTLTFSLGDMATAKTTTVTYVVEVSAGAKTGKAENVANAQASSTISNTARATVMVTEDFFMSKSFIVGRVAVGCDADSGADDDGVSGVRIYLENGTYAITDKNGMFHFEGVNPGTHVVQLDLNTVPEDYEVVFCEETDRHAGTPYSQFVDIQGGTLWRADFYLKQKPAEFIDIKGSASIELNSVLAEKDDKNQNIDYEVPVHVGGAALKNLRLTVMLPDGVEYASGTSMLGADSISDPNMMDSSLTYRLGDVEPGWEGRVRFTASIPLEGMEGEASAKAILTFDTETEKNRRTPVAENKIAREKKNESVAIPPITLHPHFESGSAVLSASDKAELDRVALVLWDVNIQSMQVIGHTDSQRISKRLRAQYAGNRELSVARAKSVAEYLAASLKLSPSQLEIDGRGPDEPVSGNDTKEGMAQNRRVELKISAEKGKAWLEIKNALDKSGIQTAEINERVEKKKQPNAPEAGAKPKANKMPDINSDSVDAMSPGFEMIWPVDGFHPPIPSLKVAVKHSPSSKIVLTLNGQEVEKVAFEGATKSKSGLTVVSLWSGVHIKEGDNVVSAVEYNDDKEINRVDRVIHYSGQPVRAEIDMNRSNLHADGHTPPVIAVKLFDKDGHPAREGVVGEYTIDPPYLPLSKVNEIQEELLSTDKNEAERFTVADDGIAMIGLEPTSQTGEAVVRVRLANGMEELRAWLVPDQREWILVGLAEGTSGYNTVSGNMESAHESGADDKYYKDGRLAFFAKGSIKGEWLMTVSYDSDKNKKGITNSLFGDIDPDEYYTVYGDASEQRNDAPSARALYVKVEKRGFYAMFGDYATGLTVTELSRYSRSLNGLKSELKSKYVDYNVFAADTHQTFVKDEVRGDGTSGLYRLSRKNIVLNSESITIETRDRFHSESAVKSQKLSRHIDYNIDYEDGTVYFKSPVPARDENSNPVYIVIDYESYDQNDENFNYGGRAALHPTGTDKIETGATYVHEDQGGREGDLTGADATVKITDNTKVKAEIAETSNDLHGVDSSGSAYMAEVSHKGGHVEAKTYIREQDPDFGLGQQKGSEAGTRKYGFDAAYKPSNSYRIKTEMFRQENLLTGAERDVAELKGDYYSDEGAGKYDLSAGLRHAEDSFINGRTMTSEQMFAGAKYRIFDNRVTLRLNHDQSIGGSNESSDYPTRTNLGADVKVTDSTTVSIDEELTYGENRDTETTRLSVKSTPWQGGQVASTVAQEDDGMGRKRTYSTNGLKQAFKVTDKLTVDAGFDKSKTLKDTGANRTNPNAPYASGETTDYTAMSLGAGYKEKDYSVTSRFEIRDSKTEDKYGVLIGAAGEVRQGVALSGRFQAFDSEYASGEKKFNSNIRLGIAYRPKRTKLIVLDRLDYKIDERRGGGGETGGFNYKSRRFVNNLNANYKLDRKTQIAFQYGAKYVLETIDDNDYSGYTDLIGIEARHDVTKKWDMGLRGMRLHSYETEQTKYSYGPSVGYNFLKHVWVSVGYNLSGFRDRDFSRANFTSKGPYIKFRMKFDQETVSEALKWFGSR